MSIAKIFSRAGLIQKESLSPIGLHFRHTYFADPVWHGVGARGAVVGVDDDDGDNDGGYDKHHGEEHVLPNERHSAGGGGDELHDDQQEDSQRQQDRDA